MASSNMMYDVESGFQTKLQGSVSFADGLVRTGFMRKVFASPVQQPAVKQLPSGALHSGIVHTAHTSNEESNSGEDVSKGRKMSLAQTPWILSGKLLVGYASSTYKTDLVVQAFGMTAAVSAGLTLYALKTKNDFTSMGGFLYSMLLSLVFGMFLNLFMGVPAMSLFLSMGGAALFSVYLIYDVQPMFPHSRCLLYQAPPYPWSAVQMLMGGTHKFSLSPDEYIFGAIAIYLDIINLFLHILRILGSNRNN
ncbi:inhibitor of apoptosis-promoting Bax1-domain-containing protein [Dunaliella salina]|uniref:Inhibitor of apoptosis-promoting Bax1-domain-containing protein n=1 Tax=Dunaliella salina TaxID=3046 RepID=A0ABQ7H730_DUNSA|nr:inhibitor of apoptosis-promoting Bax1-domain-containing protein [Dunaliella salina]|eukprot:KAF5842665.1 inhibitor of apoptosis-promoting Bax1-domain-containing protein [Dunaliella salina]